MATKYDVVGVGNAIVDVLAKVEDSFLTEHALPKGGMLLVEEEQAVRLYASLDMTTEVSGGSAANTLAGIASLGGRAAFIGKVKDDHLGQAFGHELRSIGVDYKTPAAKDGPATAKCVVSITPDAERTMATYLGATRYLAPADVDEEMISQARVTYLEGYMWDEAEAKEAIRKAIEIAEKNDRQIAFTLSDLFCVERHRTEFLRLIEEHVDILFCNEDELKALVLEDDFNAAVKKISNKCKTVAITRGHKGSLVVSDQVHTIEAQKGLNVVDSTGAGDLYAAGFLFAYTQDMDLEACGKIGTIAASEVIQHVGARPQESLAELVRRAA